MPFHVTNVQARFFPSEEAGRQAFAATQVPAEAILSALARFACKEPLVEGEGYQMSIARELANHLSLSLTQGRPVFAGGGRYSPRLNEKADLVIGGSGAAARVYFEVEFRPNVEKDLVKFQIGFNTGALAAAVLIMALDRNAINARYTTMPEYRKFERVISELAPQYPLLLCGIHGEHRDSAV